MIAVVFMSATCLDPIIAVSLCMTSDNKHKLKFISKFRHFNFEMLKEKYGSENVFALPCGKCEACRRNSAEVWSIRSVMEAKCHKYNYFLTLTFDDRHISKASKRDLDKFLDRLEGFRHQRKFKYLACMEFGELTHRLHFHVILFCDFELHLFDATKVGDYYYYHSTEIDDLWKNGLYNVAPFASSCARYVAKYTSKDGSKLFMSRNIGKQYVLDNLETIIKDDFQVYGDFGGRYCVPLPVSLLRWLPDDISLEAITKLKTLGALVSNYKLRNLGSPHEEAVLFNGREKVLSHNKRRRVL